MKLWMVVVVVASLAGCGANPEDMAGSVRKAKIDGAQKIEVKDGIRKVATPLASKGDGGGGDPGGGNCAEGYVPCGTGPCCHSATERCGDGTCHPREGSGDGGGTKEPEVAGADGAGGIR